MAIYALSDLHLSFGTPAKSMEVFGPIWKNYSEKIQSKWFSLIKPEDLVIIAGDISWAKHLKEAIIDLEWIDKLPGTKLIIKGNHDMWWDSTSKMKQVMPPSIHFIQGDAFDFGEVTFAGTRLWDSAEYDFTSYIDYIENPRENKKKAPPSIEDNEKIFTRELERLTASLTKMNPRARVKIALTHYPPIGADLAPSRASKILEEHGVDICIFGHLHSVRQGSLPFGEARGVKYLFTSCDYLDFVPLRVLE
jgi:predicted phosphohydrolase